MLDLKMKNSMLFKTMFATGAIFMIYGFAILCYLGFDYFFNYFFFAWGLILVLTALCHEDIYRRFGKKMYEVLRIITYICLGIFLIVELLVFVYSFSKPEKGAKIIIVLGSGVREDGSLSSDFKARLDKCLTYYEGNGGTIVVTGKKGRKEPVAEAVAGRNYLVKKGVPEGDIRVDDQSKNTYENIRNAYELTKDIEDKKVVIVSSCFHLFRAGFIAHKVGFKEVSLSGSIGSYSILPHYYAREFFAFVKDFIVLNRW